MEATSSSSFKAKTAAELQAVKQQSGKTYGQIAEGTGLTNVYVAQLLRGQAQLKPGTAPLLRDALPGLTDELLHEMMQPPLHSSDPNLIQEPTVYRQSRKNAPLHSENDTLSKSASQELSSFSRYINEQNVEGTSTARSIRVKEAKLKRNDEESTNIIEVLREQNRKLIEFVKRKSEDMQHAHQIQIIRDQNRLKKLARGIYEDESKLLLKDLNSITDLNLRELFRKEQARIMQKRARQQDQRSQNSCSSYGQHFDELAGPRNDLPK